LTDGAGGSSTISKLSHLHLLETKLLILGTQLLIDCLLLRPEGLALGAFGLFAGTVGLGRRRGTDAAIGSLEDLNSLLVRSHFRRSFLFEQLLSLAP